MKLKQSDKCNSTALFLLSLLSVTCGTLQIAGFFLIFLQKYPWIIFFAGLAAIIKYFIPLPNHQTALGKSAAISGFGIMGIAVIEILFS